MEKTNAFVLAVVGLIIILPAYGSEWMAYDDSDVTVYSGGYGYKAVNGTTSAGINGNTIAYAAFRARAAGRITAIKFRLYGWNQPDASGDCYLKIISGTVKTDVDVVASYDISSVANAQYGGDNNRMELDLTTWLTSNEVTIETGQFLGFYFDNDPANTVQPLSETTPYAPADPAGIKSWQKAGNVGVSTGNNFNSVELNTSPIMEFSIQTNEYMPWNDNNRGSGFDNGDDINLPAFADQPYYIIMEGVNVPDGSDLALKFKYIAATAADTVLGINTGGGPEITGCELIFDSDGSDAANDETITIDDFNSTKALTGQDGEKLNLQFWIDPVNDKMELIYYNKETGQGPTGGDRDIQHISITDRSPVTITDTIIRRLSVTSAGAGQATIDRIVVCRKPILTLYDSFVSMSSGGKIVLGRIGDKLDDPGVFTQQRYGICGGIPVNRIITDNIVTAAKTRWNDANNDQDLVGYRDVIVCVVVGAANNFSAIISDATAQQKAAHVLGEVGVVVGEALDASDALGGANECIIVGPLGAPPDTVTSYRQEFCQRLNQGLRTLAYAANTPFVDNYGPHKVGVFTDFAASDNVHPSTSACTTIAEKIVDAYEHAQVPECFSPVIGDLNNDCLLDMSDIAIIASHWLECNLLSAEECLD